MFTIETEIVEGRPVRKFNEHAPVEIVDLYGHTVAVFRDLYFWAWNFLINERPDVGMRLFAYGELLGRWEDIAPKGAQELDRAIRAAWCRHEGYPPERLTCEADCYRDEDDCQHSFVYRDDNPEISYCEHCGMDGNG